MTDDLTERASLVAMRVYGLGETECGNVVAECRSEIQRLRAALSEIADLPGRRWQRKTARDALEGGSRIVAAAPTSPPPPKPNR